ncbi:MAG: ABC transporter permease, partial [Saprospiraceae bacterium]
MLTNYFKIALRSLRTNKLSSFINIAGLAGGMAITILIGLWIYDEVNFDKYHQNYNRIGQLWQFVQFDVVKSSYNSLPQPLAADLRQKYPDFKKVCLTSFNKESTFKYEDILLTQFGMYVDPEFPDMMTFKMIKGDKKALSDPGSILISALFAKKIFKDQDPLNQTLKINNRDNLKVAGVYEDIPQNSTFYDVQYLAPWANYIANDNYAKKSADAWDENSWPIYVELNDNADFTKASASIKDIRMKLANPPKYKPEFFIHPMNKWHLQGEFYDGYNTGGLIKLVWMFGIIGIFILLLACVNFMNLSTARSEKRAREVGIRKTIGSLKSQLVIQFYIESALMAFTALIVSIGLVLLCLPVFNHIAGKNLHFPYANPLFWSLIVLFTIFTALIAGSYPAFYLSKFEPVQVLKGSFKIGSFATSARKSLVVFQYVVSIVLIVGTMVVYRQINFGKERFLGYNNAGLIAVKMITRDVYEHYDAVRNELIQSGAASNMSASMGGLTEEFGGTTNINWQGKGQDQRPLFIWNRATHDFGKTIGWELVQGRDFAREYAADSFAVILNQAALKTMNFNEPLKETVTLGGKKYQVIGIVKDIIKFDPFQQVKPYVFTLDYNSINTVNIKLSPDMPTSEALAKIEAMFKKYNPTVPFAFNFEDESYAQKFEVQVKIGRLSAIFSVLAIFISCLGLFGLASFMAEQRTKEIGVRKVLGASVFSVWTMLSKDFLILAVISLVMALPISYYWMTKWLENYSLRISFSVDI